MSQYHDPNATAPHNRTPISTSTTTTPQSHLMPEEESDNNGAESLGPNGKGYDGAVGNSHRHLASSSASASVSLSSTAGASRQRRRRRHNNSHKCIIQQEGSNVSNDVVWHDGTTIGLLRQQQQTHESSLRYHDSTAATVPVGQTNGGSLNTATTPTANSTTTRKSRQPPHAPITTRKRLRFRNVSYHYNNHGPHSAIASSSVKISLKSLPTSLLSQIVLYLPPNQYLKCFIICRKFSFLNVYADLWKEACHLYFRKELLHRVGENVTNAPTSEANPNRITRKGNNSGSWREKFIIYAQRRKMRKPNKGSRTGQQQYVNEMLRQRIHQFAQEFQRRRIESSRRKRRPDATTQQHMISLTEEEEQQMGAVPAETMQLGASHQTQSLSYQNEIQCFDPTLNFKSYRRCLSNWLHHGPSSHNRFKFSDDLLSRASRWYKTEAKANGKESLKLPPLRQTQKEQKLC